MKLHRDFIKFSCAERYIVINYDVNINALIMQNVNHAENSQQTSLNHK